jgi:endonuclease/exonuclease/phosphatase family metal-dependent hydrolase
MTYNIHRWAGRDSRLDVARLAQVIRAADADVVTLNEVLHPVTISGQEHDALAELAERLEMHFAFGPSGWLDRGGWFDRGADWEGPVGNAILSRYPLTHIANKLLPKLPGTKQRSLLEACLVGGPVQGLTAFATHLDHAFEGTRVVQMQAALAHIRRHGPHFIAGDFNTPGFVGARSRHVLPPVLLLLRRAGYSDAFQVAGKGRGHTFPAMSPLVRVDFVFVPQRWSHGLRSVRALNMLSTQHASDHRPVVAEWSWPDQPRLPAPI